MNAQSVVWFGSEQRCRWRRGARSTRCEETAAKFRQSLLSQLTDRRRRGPCTASGPLYELPSARARTWDSAHVARVRAVRTPEETVLPQCGEALVRSSKPSQIHAHEISPSRSWRNSSADEPLSHNAGMRCDPSAVSAACLVTCWRSARTPRELRTDSAGIR